MAAELMPQGAAPGRDAELMRQGAAPGAAAELIRQGAAPGAAAELMPQGAAPGAAAETSREQWIAECVARVIARLRLRRHAELVLSLASLTREWSDDAPLRHACLRVTQTTAFFLRRLAAGTEEDTAIDVLRQAWRCGMTVTLELDPAEFGRLPVSGLVRLPLRFCTADGTAVHLLARRVAGYADIVPLSPGYLVLPRAVLLTALAGDEAAKRGVQLYRQD